ncbi:hypothetical protein CPC08DRAFT_791306 [Agrocybe pediades]|nr:hypothetical protein CPC08DRAFT_791306 [Agrocybe pediades]
METVSPSQREYLATARGDLEKINGELARILPDLPVELHALIINELKGDTKALKRCALTCTMYRHLAQKLLFKSVVFPPNSFTGVNESKSVNEFVAFLEDSPQIVNCAERLIVREKKAINRVISSLVNVVDLVFRDLADFWHLELDSRRAIIGKCESLVSLTLHNIKGVPLSLFNHLQHLERLDIDNTIFLDDPVVRSVPTCHRSRIKKMKLANAALRSREDTIYPFLKDQRFGEDSLEMLSIVMVAHWAVYIMPPMDWARPVESLIKSYAKSLKILEVTIPSNVPVDSLHDVQLVFDLSTMSLLEELSVECWIGFHVVRAYPTIGLRELSRHLETIPPDRKLKKIMLRLHIDRAVCVQDHFLNFEGLQYFENLIVDRLLSQTESLSIILEIEDPDFPHFAKEQMRKGLPRLRALNLLLFSKIL